MKQQKTFQSLRLIVCALLLSLTPLLWANQASAAIGGKRVAVLVPFTAGATTGSESPSTHGAFGANFAFAWDVHGGASTAVYPRVNTSDGAVTMNIVNIYTSSNGAGQGVDVGIYVAGTYVGKLRYSHLVNVGVTNNQSDITTATRLGDTAPNVAVGNCVGFACSDSWDVHSAAGIHTHMEFSQACYGPQGVSSAVAATTGIALLSQNYGAANKTACDGAELSAVATGGGGSNGGPQTIGSYNAGSGTFYLRNSNTPGAADLTVQYGNANWIPLAGDWDGSDDGNKEMTIGAYDPATGWFYLRNSNTPGAADTAFQYGNIGWLPIAGDWDGNGFWSIGLYNPATATFYLRNSNSSGGADYTFQFGNGNWVPLAGDWDGSDDGNAATTIGAYNPANATFYLNNQNDSSAAESTIQYGNIGWKPITGDWDGNSFASIGLYDPNSATFYLRNSNSAGAADITTQYGNSGWLPIAGDWNGQ